MIDKRALLAVIRREIAEEISTVTRLAKDAADAATHEENKPENEKDMRATEASYVARGQAERVRELERGLTALSTMMVKTFADGAMIEASAVVEVRHRGNVVRYLLVPAAGGRRACVEDVEVQTLTTTSPLGEALLGLTAGDEAEVPAPQGMKLYEILRVE